MVKRHHAPALAARLPLRHPIAATAALLTSAAAYASSPASAVRPGSIVAPNWIRATSPETLALGLAAMAVAAVLIWIRRIRRPFPNAMTSERATIAHVAGIDPAGAIAFPPQDKG